jgi:hypothetical protein
MPNVAGCGSVSEEDSLIVASFAVSSSPMNPAPIMPTAKPQGTGDLTLVIKGQAELGAARAKHAVFVAYCLGTFLLFPRQRSYRSGRYAAIDE